MFDLLKGVRVIDLTTIVLGPYATQFLGDFGADVIKVEPPGGDLFRAAGPARTDAMGSGFLGCNRNKRSIVLDLARPEGLDALRRLVATADVVVHNMRPKSARKLGIAFEDLREVKPDLVYCYACGFGQGGPLADEPAYDDTIQAASGLAFLNANELGEPRFLPTIIADKVGGLHLAIAILAGLASKERTGQGTCIEAPMFESMASFLLVEQLGGKAFDPPLGPVGYERLNSPHRRPFATRDGWISIIPYTRAHWTSFLDLIGRADLCADPRVTDPVERSRSIDLLYGLIADAAPGRTTAEWLDLLRVRGVPCAEVNRLEDLLDDPHLLAVGMFDTTAHPSEGRLTSVRSPFVIGDEIGGGARPAPALGQHGLEILREAGFSPREASTLVETGVAEPPMG